MTEDNQIPSWPMVLSLLLQGAKGKQEQSVPFRHTFFEFLWIGPVSPLVHSQGRMERQKTTESQAKKGAPTLESH